MDGKTQYGLWLNITREQVRRSSVTSAGIGVSLGGDVDEKYFLNLTNNVDQAKLMAYRAKKGNKNGR